jgi:N-acetylglucosaminyldiphosphoundecaprenol N-acetyl-beta-D-mannosaminyltransferase
LKENILGVDVCTVDMDQAISEAKSIIEKRIPGFIVAINPEKIMKAVSDESLKELLNTASLQIPDGIGILMASKIKGGNVKNRVTGIDLMMNLCNMASINGYSVYLLGAASGTADNAAKILKSIFPKLTIAGTHDGYFNNNDEKVIQEISKTNCDILFVAMGSPKQEYWIKSNVDKLNVPLLIGVGGSYDVICGNIKRAPLWMRKSGIEWLYRLICEPWRIKRMISLPLFLLKALKSSDKVIN